ncbi:hypothetical protein FTUN_1282 [Frigoriglobus tundricola]|uniref:Uncharacterized protein n=1 Tax=Frigoriglobus tundricola TaxID=2774151 RepID=A0A6M5YKE1_9BACT|nr:hypothetical protein FTUN_1282 [Frigoriglobus tundricola]
MSIGPTVLGVAVRSGPRPGPSGALLARVRLADRAPHEVRGRVAIELLGLGLADAHAVATTARAAALVGVRSRTVSRRSRCAGSGERPWSWRRFAGPSPGTFGGFGVRSDRRPNRCVVARSNFAFKAATSARRSSMVRWNCSAWRWSCVRRSAFSAWRARTIPWRVSTSVGSGASESMPKDGSGRAGAQVGFGRFRATITGETFGRRVVDAVEDHGELGGGEFEFAVGRGGEVVPPALESLAPQAEPVAGPVQGLEPVGRAIGENEQMPAQGIGLKRGLDVAVQAVEPEAQIDGPAVPELGGGWNAQHGRPSTACTRAAMTSGRASTGNRRTVPDGNTTSIGGPAGDGVRRMGTSVGVTGTGDGAWSARVRRHT